jgi:hypothetical protein
MKRYLFIAVLAVMACSRVAEPEVPSEEAPSGPVRIHFRADQVDTRARFGALENGAYPTLWTANDSEVKLSLNYGGAIPAEVTPSGDGRSATFDAEVDFGEVDGPYTFYSVSPASAASALSPSREAWKVSIPCEQAPTDDSADEAGILIAASSIPFTEAPAGPTEVALHFDHLTAYGRLSFSNLELDGATVQSVELTATTPFVGDWYWKCEGSHELIDYGASSTLTLTTHRTTDIWFACAPVDMSGQMMEVTVTTDRGIYGHIVEFPSGRKFEAGRTAVFTVDMAGANYTPSPSGGSAFTLVTDASSLNEGDEVLIVYAAGNVAMGSKNASGNYRDQVSVSIDNDVIASAGEATVLTLCAGSVAGTWAFRDGSVYLASASTGNSLKNSDSITGYASWTVSVESDGKATLQAQEGASTYLRYNNSSNSERFSCYSGTNLPAPSLFRRSGMAASADPILSCRDYGAYLGTGQEWILDSGTDQVTRAYDANGVLTYTLIDADEVEELEITGYTKSKTKGSRFTVSVHWRKGFATLLSTTYSVTLVKEEGPKVWLSDGTGHGFIIKK